MRYMLLIYADESAADGMTPDEMAEGLAAYQAFNAAAAAEGILRDGDALHATANATTVRVRDGEAVLTDGPFAEAREQLGGYYVVECETLDQAIDAARRIPGAHYGAVEVRPLMEYTL